MTPMTPLINPVRVAEILRTVRRSTHYHPTTKLVGFPLRPDGTIPTWHAFADAQEAAQWAVSMPTHDGAVAKVVNRKGRLVKLLAALLDDARATEAARGAEGNHDAE